MAKDDILDPERAAAFAWRTAEQLDSVVESVSDDTAPAAELSPEARARQRAEDRARCDELAGLVRRAWLETDPSRRAQATLALTQRAVDLGLPVAGLPPREAVRFFRLMIKHRLVIPEALLEEAALSLSLLTLESPELGDLVLDVVESGHQDLALGLAFARRPPQGGIAGLGAKLLPILQNEACSAQRWLAASFADWAGDFTILVPALRRALGAPHLRLRLDALDRLLDAGVLTADDVQALLDDAVVHPPPRDAGEWCDVCYDYARSLGRAVAELRPPRGYRPLLSILSHDCVFIRGERGGLDDGFALSALAAAYPERALDAIDHGLLGAVRERYDATGAAGELPETLARPRLERAAMDACALVRERARQLWFRRFGEECTVRPELWLDLEAPASEAVQARLSVLSGQDRRAKGAMVAALLGEAPEREALRLLLFALAHDEPLGDPSLPRTRKAWAEVLLERFGDAAFKELLPLAEEQARAGVEWGWLEALTQRRGRLLDASQKATLSALVERVLLEASSAESQTPPLVGVDVLRAFAALGTPNSCVDPLWRVAFEQGAEEQDFQAAIRQYEAIAALAAVGSHPELDARVARELGEALDDSNVERAQQLVGLAIQRQLADLEPLVERGLDLSAQSLALYASDPASTLASMCLVALEQRGGLSEQRRLGWLRDPASPLFAIVARRVEADQKSAVEALHAALQSTASHGAAAACAAQQLIWLKQLSVSDPRLESLLERAPLEARVDLASCMCFEGADLARLEHPFLEALGSDDEELARRAFGSVCAQRDPARATFERALEQGVHDALRDQVLAEAGHPTETELYFVDR